jgi:putative sugar O-methyltransferase
MKPPRFLKPLFPSIRRVQRRKDIFFLEHKRWKELLSTEEYQQNLKQIDRCFDQVDFPIIADEKLQRIREAYQRSVATQLQSGPAFNVSNEWIPIYERYMGEVISKLKTTGPVDELQAIYSQFMRHDCSFGLHGLPGDMTKTYFTGVPARHDAKLFAADNAFRIKHWVSQHPNELVATLRVPSVGNPYGYMFRNEKIRIGAEYFHHYSSKIKELLEGVTNPSVAELGGGYGGQAYFLLRDIPNLSYVDFDLPENAALTTYFLMQSFPDKSFVLFGEEGFEEALNNPSSQVVVAPSFCIANLSSKSRDLFFNSYSLAEMSKQTITTYVGYMCSVARKYILHVNHAKIYNEIGADEFPFDTDQFSLISREPALWNSARNLHTDEFEYLFKRKGN